MILRQYLSQALSRGADKEGRVQAFIAEFLAHVVDNLIEPLAKLAVNWRYLTAGIAFGCLLLAMSAIAGGYLKFAAFPDLDGDVMEARILLPQGTPLARTEEVVGQVEAALRRVNQKLTPDQPGGQNLITNVTLKFNHNTDAKETGPHVATIIADMLSSDSRNSRIDDVLAQWRTETGIIPDVIFIKFSETQIGPAGLDIEIRLDGTDLRQLGDASRDLQLLQYINSEHASLLYDISSPTTSDIHQDDE